MKDETLEQLVLEGHKKKTICRVLQINRVEYYRKNQEEEITERQLSK